MRQIKFFLLFFIVVNFFSCSSDKNKNHNLFNMYLLRDPVFFDPRVAGNSEPQIIIGALFEGLMRLDPQGNLEPGLAMRYEMAEDYLSCTFYLRKTVWSNGDPVTAHNFADAWREALSPKFDTNHAFAFYHLKNGKAAREGKVPLDQIGVKALDDQTLLVEFEYPAPFFIELAANPLFSPVYSNPSMELTRNSHTDSSKDGRDDRLDALTTAGEHYPKDKARAVDSEGRTDRSNLSNMCELVSNGPFILKEYKKENYLLLKKNKKYWDAETVQIDGIFTMFIPNANTALMMYELGQLDIFGKPISEIPLEAGWDMEKKGMLRSFPSSSVSWLIFNTEKPPFNSKKIRKAFSYAINRKKIVNDLLQRGDFPSTSILPKNLILQEEPYFADGNIKEARKLFEEGLLELGMTRETMPKIELTFSSGCNQKSIVQAIQDQWRAALDILVQLHMAEKSVYAATNTKNEFQIASISWDSWISDPLYNLGHLKTKNRLNLSQWENSQYRELIELAEKETSKEQRLKYFHQAETLLMDEMPVAPIFSWVSKYSVKEGVEGLCFARDGRLCLKWIKKQQIP